jgi:23S rRNA (cytidine1920-2'-O)/16S rRNA (cytidine1409-2'-O)-methyltransferase
MTKKKRIDELLVLQGIIESLDNARRLILAGSVRVGRDHIVKKPSDLYEENTPVFIESGKEYVSRGAHKLRPAIDKYFPDGLNGLVALDIGASTGGFTDLMLQRGAKKVYAVDVGYGQLHFKLRKDPRVVSLEKCNARYLDETIVPEKVNIITIDVSFISVTAILPAADRLASPGCISFILVKPQFECEKGEIGEGGVVTDTVVHEKCVQKAKRFAEQSLQWDCIDTIPSPILGPKGNQEYVLVCRKRREKIILP